MRRTIQHNIVEHVKSEDMCRGSNLKQSWEQHSEKIKKCDLVEVTEGRTLVKTWVGRKVLNIAILTGK